MISTQVLPFTMVKHAWSEAARDGLRDTFSTSHEAIEKGVISGKMELWRVNGESWAVTEVMSGMLFIWCYQGRDAVPFVNKMREVARGMKLAQVSFFSQRRGAARAWKRFNPRRITTQQSGENGEYQYIFEVTT